MTTEESEAAAYDAQALQQLCQFQLKGTLELGAVWLALSDTEIRALRQCALGTVDGGPATAVHLQMLHAEREEHEQVVIACPMRHCLREGHLLADHEVLSCCY